MSQVTTKQQQIAQAKGAIANKALDEQAIHDKIIEVQEAIAAVTDMIDAFGRQHASNESNAQIFIWAQSIEGSIRKAKSVSRTNLLADGKPKIISVGIHNIDITYTAGGITLDTAKLKKLDSLTYSTIAKMYPKKSAARARIKITEKKGVI